MYKIIACDLDETLLNDQHQISQKDIESIKKATALGVKFVIGTGRPFNSAYEDLKKLDLYDKADEYVISFNGSVITENKGNRVISSIEMPFEKINELYKKGVEFDTCIHAYSIDTVYVYNYFDFEREYIEGRMNIKEIFDRDLENYRHDTFIKLLFADLDHKVLESYRDRMTELIDDVELSFSSNRYIEFNMKGIDKGRGLRALADYLNIDIRDTIAVGDNVNDLPMIKAAGLGIGVRNVNPRIKDECDYILDSSNNEDPMTEVIDKFILPDYEKQ